jgi:hypothetical protein
VFGARRRESAVGEDHVGRHQAVHRHAVVPGEVAGAAAEGEAGDAGGRHEPGRRRQAEGAGGMVDVSPGAAGVDTDRAGQRVDGGGPKPGEVDDQCAVRGTESGTVVATTAYRQRDLVVASA